ncbi:MAG: glycosyltransferase [Methanotrichaceae archaeon]|nr:glycosyltransferase [Methanotrichaceae archaeon]
MILIARGLVNLGHTVFIMANQYDSQVVSTFATKIIDVPVNSGDYLNSNEYTTKWLNQTWDDHFNANDLPDLVLVGGWPFFSSIPFLKKACKNVIFVDFGAVPLDGYSGGSLATQEKLRSLRKQYLKEASLIIGISDFISNSQSKVDAGSMVPVRTVLLGADHMEMSIWPAENLNLEQTRGNATRLIKSLKDEGRDIILCLGRWEPNCYKNSDAVFDVMRQIIEVIPKCTLLILSKPSDINIPQDLHDSIHPIGFPDDDELICIMKQVDLGISVSLWEGFNLPIAEMQWHGRTVLVFNIGAHPEVILHPWYLCKDNDEMAAKACKILKGNGLESHKLEESLNIFRNYFRWDRAVRDYAEIIQSLADPTPTRNSDNIPISLIIDVTNATRDPANSGVIRVTRRLSREFQRYLNPIFVVWDYKTANYVLPISQEYRQLGKFNGPLMADEMKVSPDNYRIPLSDYLSLVDSDSTWLLFSETIDEMRGHLARRYARENGINLAAIFYDAIPVLFPDLCKDSSIRYNHSNYLVGLSECDVVIPISKFSSDCLEKFWSDNDIKGCRLSPNLLPGEFGLSERNTTVQIPSNYEKIHILCVSTLEPRKNHRTLIDACLLMEEKYPDLNWGLTLVGNRYAGADDIVDFIQDVSAKNSRIRWLGVVDDAKLHALYDEATFTVYPSIIEGFGMPILESVWHGRPCICYREGVMAELAEGGGCLTTDVLDVQGLSESIYRLATDRALLIELSGQAVSRNIKTWDEYTREFLSILISNDETTNNPIVEKESALMEDWSNWEEILYPGCLCSDWQMNHSERMAMIGLLFRLKPKCCIEIGTYRGGSLSLISQYSDMVFSIDLDPSIPERLKGFKNVCFLTGSSNELLPMLLTELEDEHIPIDFIFIDGEHSADSIKRDMDCLLSYKPTKHLFVMVHDSFNPECRRGILGAEWDKSPYVQFVDVDFVPGRAMGHGTPSKIEMWGGLALMHFSPSARKSPLNLNCSAKTMYEFLEKSNNTTTGY